MTVEAGARFGAWTVLAPAETRHWRKYWLCRCDCGQENSAAEKRLLAGQSHGCRRCVAKGNKHGVTHGESDSCSWRASAEYRTWVKMHGRCRHKTDKRYEQYGGRGIRVCERWATYEAFLADVGRRPSAKHSLDRINVNGHYEPGNVRWATQIEQQRNRTNNRHITFRGRTQTLSAWVEELELVRTRVWARLSMGWDVERAFTAPHRDRRGTTATFAREEA
jgi:hypothetical protein